MQNKPFFIIYNTHKIEIYLHTNYLVKKGYGRKIVLEDL